MWLLSVASTKLQSEKINGSLTRWGLECTRQTRNGIKENTVNKSNNTDAFILSLGKPESIIKNSSASKWYITFHTIYSISGKNNFSLYLLH